MKIRISKIKSIKRVNFEGDVYNLHLKSNEKSKSKDDLFWIEGESGIINHNCFPKDLNALRFVAENLGIDPKVLKSVWEKNLEVRQPQFRDWETMKGRAVSEE